MRPDWHPAMVAYDVAVNVVETVLEGGLQRALAAVLVLARCPVPDAELSPAGFQGDALCADGEAPAPAPADRAAAKAAKAADRAAADIAFDLALSKLRPLTLTKPQVVTILKHPTPPRSRSAASAVDPRLWLGDVEAAGGGVKCDRVSDFRRGTKSDERRRPRRRKTRVARDGESQARLSHFAT
ncbi:hypothetical protein M885DRAFT_173638 [Pelagophyceae sp. CCMP2097]|nr:hypothetical protein M885DRAFT_173638 [Pelagophyceae sp. CCMP2097]